MNKKPELLAPAGSLEKLKIAVKYGADAVYLAGKSFGLRARATNFSESELLEGLHFAHINGVKVYVTVNILAHNPDIDRLPSYVRWLQTAGVDAVIVADIGVLSLIKEHAPGLEVHVSTQANVTNFKSAEVMKKLGASRVVVARELSIDEIAQIRQKADIEVESFIHGAMCMAYSGRCLLSSYMTGRSANRGDCAQPCRWSYHLVEQQRPGEYMPVESDDRGTYIMSSKDLMAMEFLDKLVYAGIDSLKIEGRMKSVHYVATVVNAYRQALDSIYNGEEFNSSKWIAELKKASNREFTSGFYHGKADHTAQNVHSTKGDTEYDFVGIVQDNSDQKKHAIIEQRNHFSQGEEVEIMMPGGIIKKAAIKNIWDEEGNVMEKAPHPQQLVKVALDTDVKEFAILRREK
ncbi:U32 family peptidase [Proteinivorax hydrogeniformans]|uniref:U32 family peptidase n=1 Tax=Proteinivorax hydrogeniformans TaxID=1826727 RepID=A0AAU8HS44_9FIRM